jgi:glycosyltransferase involved in cell wall biosynthesis
MTSPAPLISVTLPNYNHGHYLAHAFDSVLAQTYTQFEILFTDDGSTDESVEIARRYAAQDTRIKAVYFEKNQGALVAHANTWQRAAGEIVYQFSSDDYLVDRDFFRLGVEAMAAHPEAAGFFGIAGTILSETGQSLGPMGHASPAGFVAPTPFLQGFLRHRFFVPGISSLWRKAEIDRLGGYDARLGPQTDYFVNHALPARSGVVFLPRLFAHARTSAKRTSFSSAASLEDELRRLALFASKLRSLTGDHGVSEADWNSWRKEQAGYLLARHGRAALDLVKT